MLWDLLSLLRIRFSISPRLRFGFTIHLGFYFDLQLALRFLFHSVLLFICSGFALRKVLQFTSVRIHFHLYIAWGFALYLSLRRIFLCFAYSLALGLQMLSDLHYTCTCTWICKLHSVTEGFAFSQTQDIHLVAIGFRSILLNYFTSTKT